MIIFLSILSASLFILLLLSYIDNARMRKALQTIQEAVKLELEKRK